MGHIRPPDNVKLVIAMISNGRVKADQWRPELEAAFGPIDYLSDAIPFDFTEYYKPEMGGHLFRQFIAFRDLIDPGDLATIKRRSNAIEDKWGQQTESGLQRNINLDAGYLTLSSFVLASTKNYSHRIYLRDGIYAEIELIYKHNQFQPVPWTYRDYLTAEYHAALHAIRDIYKQQLQPNEV